MFRASSCPSPGFTTAVEASDLPSELDDSSAVGRGRAGRLGYRLYDTGLERWQGQDTVLSSSMSTPSGFGGLEVACWPLIPKFAGSHPAEAVGFFGRKNPQHAFLRRGSKAVGPMS
jgi:hypothetical protein